MLPIKMKIDESFLDAEIRNGYSISNNMKKIWAVLLDLLNEFSRVCEKNNIQWFADAGTILGAARHKGFIPWDDDIDVMMTRENYNKLCEIAEFEFSQPYFFQTEYNDFGSIRGHAQLRNSLTTGILSSEKEMKLKINQGIFLDIFPVDNIPDDYKQRAKFIKKVEKARLRTYRIGSITSRYIKKGNSFRDKVKAMLHFFLKNNKKLEIKYYKKYEILEQKYLNIKTLEVAKLFIFPFKERRIWKSEWLDDVTYLDFEMIKIPVPIGYIDLLDKFYGNWHEFKIGTSTHGGVLFDAEKSYKEYIK